MTPARIARRKATRLGPRSSAGDDPARLPGPHPSLMATGKQRLAALSPRPAAPDRPPSSRPRPLLPAQSTIPTMPAAAKSP